MFDLVFNHKLQKIDIMSVDVSKQNLKFLLKLQMSKNKAGTEDEEVDFWESAKSEIISI